MQNVAAIVALLLSTTGATDATGCGGVRLGATGCEGCGWVRLGATGAAGASGAAGAAAETGAAGAEGRAQPTSRGAEPEWQVDVAAGGLAEMWDRNETREWLAGLVLGADRHAWRGFALRSELLLLHVWQQGRDAWLRGITLGTRKRFQLSPPPGQRRSGPTTVFIDLAVGVSDATSPVPTRGTRFNYLALIGGGGEFPAGRFRLTVAGRWFHVSNNGREGRHLNPDVQTLGAFVGVGWRK